MYDWPPALSMIGAVTDRLVAEGYDVIRAWDGPGAVAQFTAHAPDLLLLDVMLPGFDRREWLPCV